MTDHLVPVRGGYTLVSEGDLSLLEHSWGLVKRSDATGGHYVAAWIEGKTTYLHRMVMGAGPGQEVDHINGDGLDNSRSNLRIATRSQNCANRRDYKPKSGFRGVYAQPTGRTWQVKISVNNQIIRGGNFSDPGQAARKYDEMAREYFGDFAVLNFPMENA